MGLIRLPRRIDFGYRPYKGLSVRQIFWLGLGFGLAGVLILADIGWPLAVKLVLGAVIVCGGVALAFVPLWGRSLDAWVPLLFRYYLSPRQRVWRKAGGEAVDVELAEVTEFAPPQPVALPHPAVPLDYSPLGVVMGFWLSLSMAGVLIYLARLGGLAR